MLKQLADLIDWIQEGEREKAALETRINILEATVEDQRRMVNKDLAEYIEAIEYLAKHHNLHWVVIFHRHWSADIMVTLNKIKEEHRQITEQHRLEQDPHGNLNG